MSYGVLDQTPSEWWDTAWSRRKLFPKYLWSRLSGDLCVPLSFLVDHVNEPWNWERVAERSDLTIGVITSLCRLWTSGSRPMRDFFERLSSHPDLNVTWFQACPEAPWDLTSLHLHPHATWDWILFWNQRFPYIWVRFITRFKITLLDAWRSRLRLPLLLHPLNRKGGSVGWEWSHPLFLQTWNISCSISWLELLDTIAGLSLVLKQEQQPPHVDPGLQCPTAASDDLHPFYRWVQTSLDAFPTAWVTDPGAWWNEHRTELLYPGHVSKLKSDSIYMTYVWDALSVAEVTTWETIVAFVDRPWNWAMIVRRYGWRICLPVCNSIQAPRTSEPQTQTRNDININAETMAYMKMSCAHPDFVFQQIIDAPHLPWRECLDVLQRQFVCFQQTLRVEHLPVFLSFPWDMSWLNASVLRCSYYDYVRACQTPGENWQTMEAQRANESLDAILASLRAPSFLAEPIPGSFPYSPVLVARAVLFLRPDLDWKWDACTRFVWSNECLSSQIHRNWKFDELSKRSTLAWDMIAQHLDRPWWWSHLSRRTDVSTKHLRSLQQKLCWTVLSQYYPWTPSLLQEWKERITPWCLLLNRRVDPSVFWITHTTFRPVADMHPEPHRLHTLRTQIHEELLEVAWSPDRPHWKEWVFAIHELDDWV